MLIQRNDNKKKANGNLDHLGTLGEVSFVLTSVLITSGALPTWSGEKA